MKTTKHKPTLLPTDDEENDHIGEADHDSGYGPFSIGDSDEEDGDDDHNRSENGRLHAENGNASNGSSASPSSAVQRPIKEYRSLDRFFEEAYHSIDSHRSGCSNFCRRLPYYRMVIIIGSANIANTMAYDCVRYLLSDEDFKSDILHDKTETLGSLFAGTILTGMVLGGMMTSLLEALPLSTWAGGRKSMLCYGLTLNLLGALLMVASYDYVPMLIGRFISGVGTGFNISSSTALMTELAPPKERGFFVAFVDSHWTVGNILLSTLALVCFGYLSISWRNFLAICVLFPLVSLIAVCYSVPESPRFLALRGEFQKSANVMNNLAARVGHFPGDNDEPDRAPLSSPRANGDGDNSDEHGDVIDSNVLGPLTVSEIEHHFSEKRAMMNTSDNETQSCIRSSGKSLKSLFTGRQFGNTMTLLFLWISLSSVGSLSMWITELFEEVHIEHIYLTTLVTSISTVPGNIVAILLLDRVGRNKVFVGTMLLLAITLGYFSYLAMLEDHKAFLIVLSASLYFSLLNAGWNAVMVMSGEAFPTKTRYCGLALVATVGRLSGFFSQFWNGALMYSPSLQLLVACGVALSGAMVSCCCSVDEMAQHSVDDFAKGDHESSEAHDTGSFDTQVDDEGQIMLTPIT